MLNKLRARLILFYTVITSFILSVVVLGACYMNVAQLKQSDRNRFSVLLDAVEYKLQTEEEVTHTWLSEIEASERLIIHLEENAAPFFFKGSWHPPIDRAVMITKVKKLAEAEGIDTKALPASFGNRRSSILSLQGENREAALASVSIIPVRNGFISLTLVQFLPDQQHRIYRQLLIFTALDLLGCLLLLFVSHRFVGIVLKPVEENRRKQSEFIAAASHDLRSPLAVIQANASALLIKGSEPQEFVPKITAECSRMSRLIHDMLLLAASDARSWELQKSQLDTESYLIDLYDTFSSLCKKERHQLSLELPKKPLPPLVTDKDRLTQVLGILIDNAIAYSPEGSRIILRPVLKKKVMHIEVEDHGIGIVKEQKPLVFDRFYRADHSRKASSHFGLGLSIAKELMIHMEGNILLRDTLGGGATFIVELPFP